MQWEDEWCSPSSDLVFVRGVLQLRTPFLRYKKTWGVSIPLEYFKGSEKNYDLSLKDLRVKLCALLLIVSDQRVQTVHLTKLSCIRFRNQGCAAHIVDKLKHTRPTFHQSALQVPNYAEKLCVVDSLQEHVDRVASIGAGSDQLLLCFSKTHRPVSKGTVARWLNCISLESGIANFAPHIVNPHQPC